MNLYKFEYETWDEYYCFELCHNEKFSEEQLIEMQNKILEQILKEQKATFEKIKEENMGFKDWLFGEPDIVNRIKDIFIEQYGFIEINYNNILYTSMEGWYKKYIQLKEDNKSKEGK